MNEAERAERQAGGVGGGGEFAGLTWSITRLLVLCPVSDARGTQGFALVPLPQIMR